MITRNQALYIFGGHKNLLKALNLKAYSTIYHWKTNGPIPEFQFMKIRLLKPDVFNESGDVKESIDSDMKKSVARYDVQPYKWARK